MKYKDGQAARPGVFHFVSGSATTNLQLVLNKYIYMWSRVLACDLESEGVLLAAVLAS